MPKLLLQYSDIQKDFLPLTLTRPFTSLRIGILSVEAKWMQIARHQGIDLELLNEAQYKEADLVWKANLIPKSGINLSMFFEGNAHLNTDFIEVKNPWDIIRENVFFMLDDVANVKAAYINLEPKPGIIVSGDHPVMLHPDARVESCFINTNEGPVIVDEHAMVMQGAMLRGPIYVGKNSTVKMGATLYAGTNIGNDCIVGGEVKNTIFQSFSNKGHHGYVGDSYIGEWCNLGAGTSCSNLKNTAGMLQAWEMSTESFQGVGKKAGMLMGDHVKTAIHTSFNSGTVIAGFSNVFSSSALLPKFIPPFNWGLDQDIIYDIDKAIVEIERWMLMKGQKPTERQIQDIKSFHLQTKSR